MALGHINVHVDIVSKESEKERTHTESARQVVPDSVFRIMCNVRTGPILNFLSQMLNVAMYLLVYGYWCVWKCHSELYVSVQVQFCICGSENVWPSTSRFALFEHSFFYLYPSLSYVSIQRRRKRRQPYNNHFNTNTSESCYLRLTSERTRPNRESHCDPWHISLASILE